MKKLLLVSAVLLTLGFSSQAQAGVVVGDGYNGPAYYGSYGYPPYYYDYYPGYYGYYPGYIGFGFGYGGGFRGGHGGFHGGGFHGGGHGGGHR
jgi:hypothetical protein